MRKTKSTVPSMSITEIRALIDVMREHGILELELQDSRGKIRLVQPVSEKGVQATVRAA